MRPAWNRPHQREEQHNQKKRCEGHNGSAPDTTSAPTESGGFTHKFIQAQLVPLFPGKMQKITTRIPESWLRLKRPKVGPAHDHARDAMGPARPARASSAAGTQNSRTETTR
jgi:hypothetical protein